MQPDQIEEIPVVEVAKLYTDQQLRDIIIDELTKYIARKEYLLELKARPVAEYYYDHHRDSY